MPAEDESHGWQKKKKNKAKAFQHRTFHEEYRQSFDAVKLLDNVNVYGVILSECIDNIFHGMWSKVLTPYTLFLCNDRTQVGNLMTLSGCTRAVSGVVAGRLLINSFGADNTFQLAGLLGIFGIAINFGCLLLGSLPAMYVLNFVWAVYNGLWNSCLETEWARSVLKEKREEVNGARQMSNKASTAAGPLFSIALFLYFGNKWTIPLMTSVMLVGTSFTVFPVLICFCFSRSHEVFQEVELSEVKKIEFANDYGMSELHCSMMRKADFTNSPGGYIKLTYPLKGTSKYSKLQVLTPDLKETNFILGKQVRASFKGVEEGMKVCLVHFEDKSRQCVRASIESLLIFLAQDGFVKREVSTISFNLWPAMPKETPRGSVFVRATSRVFAPRKSQVERQPTRDDLNIALLKDEERGVGTTSFSLEPATATASKSGKNTQYTWNIRTANVIVVCDVLNAIGSGMSLKFIDLFLIEDYAVSPVSLLIISLVQNLASVYLTPMAKKTITQVRSRGYSGAVGVVCIWFVSLSFLGVICLPGTPLWVVVPAIIMMQSLNTCTKSYNKARLVNALPQKQLANYMVWDSLNKANQGGVATFGGMLVYWKGYRACFACTFVFMLCRILLYAGHAYLEGISKAQAPEQAEQQTDQEEAERFEALSVRVASRADGEGEDTEFLRSASDGFLLVPPDQHEERERRESMVDELQPAEEDMPITARLSLESRSSTLRSQHSVMSNEPYSPQAPSSRKTT